MLFNTFRILLICIPYRSSQRTGLACDWIYFSVYHRISVYSKIYLATYQVLFKTWIFLWSICCYCTTILPFYYMYKIKTLHAWMNVGITKFCGYAVTYTQQQSLQAFYPLLYLPVFVCKIKMVAIANHDYGNKISQLTMYYLFIFCKRLLCNTMKNLCASYCSPRIILSAYVKPV